MTTRGEVLDAINRWPGGSFEFGRVDCCQFAGWMVRELTGKDVYSEFQYSTHRDALWLLRRAGGLTGLLTRVLGDPVGVHELGPGDVALISVDGDELAGVCIDSERVAVLTESGRPVEINTILVSRGWKCQA